MGAIMLYSAAGGNFQPWAIQHIIRFSVGLVGLIIVALIPIRFWYQMSYLIYFVAFLLLVYVEIKGSVGMGAKRWIDLQFIQLQPSEMMKIALIMALARYFNDISYRQTKQTLYLIIPLILVGLPCLLVLKQPDLGTTIMLFACATIIFFIAGVQWWKFSLFFGSIIASLPFLWSFLHDYQKKRVLIFLDPDQDPLGAGYHITQSKIAMGSGGFFGKGYLQGTQSHLNFLPEKQTDFIFTMIGEELGFVGGLSIILLYCFLILYGHIVAFRSRHCFGKYLATGIVATLFLYLFINTAMVMGLMPVVGIPLPLVSYGGTAMLTILFAFGLLMSIYIHYNQELVKK